MRTAILQQQPIWIGPGVWPGCVGTRFRHNRVGRKVGLKSKRPTGPLKFACTALNESSDAPLCCSGWRVSRRPPFSAACAAKIKLQPAQADAVSAKQKLCRIQQQQQHLYTQLIRKEKRSPHSLLAVEAVGPAVRAAEVELGGRPRWEQPAEPQHAARRVAVGVRVERAAAARRGRQRARV